MIGGKTATERLAMKQKQHVLSYKGIKYRTDYWTPITDEEFRQCREDYYRLPSREEVLDQLEKISNGGKDISVVTRYYFRDLMAKVKLKFNNWTVEDVFECKELAEHLLAKCQRNEIVYPPEWTIEQKLTKCLGLAGKGVASPPTQFRLDTVDQVLRKYNVNWNYYDFSCGWGVRLLGAMRNMWNYYGTDPNHLLCERLARLKDDYERVCPVFTGVDIRCQGSEVLVPEWRGKIGLAFSSPPYFDVEDYAIGEGQSYKQGVKYKDWLNGYVKGTLQNIHEYLVDGGFLIINTKNVDKYRLVDDWSKLARRNGFEHYGMEWCEVHNRSYGIVGGDGMNYQNDGNEPMEVFRKK